jgi:hypothetical protein
MQQQKQSAPVFFKEKYFVKFEKLRFFCIECKIILAVLKFPHRAPAPKS